MAGEGAGKWYESEYQEICGEIVSPRNDCTNKTRTKVISMDILTWRERRFHRVPSLVKDL